MIEFAVLTQDLVLPPGVEAFLRVLTTLFAAGNVIPVLPIAHGFVEHLEADEARAVMRSAYLSAVGVAAVLALTGTIVFDALGILAGDLRVAGGLILLVFSVYDLLFSTSQRKDRGMPHGPHAQPEEAEEVGLVPLGLPLLVGPAVLTVVLVSSEAEGAVPTLGALAVVGALNLVALQLSPRIMGLLGKARAKVVGKVTSLLLAALAVSMIRVGLTEFFAAAG